jgi:hypothetical protein
MTPLSGSRHSAFWHVGYRHLIALAVSAIIVAIALSLPEADDYISTKQSAFFAAASIVALLLYALGGRDRRSTSVFIVCLLLFGTIVINLYNMPSLPGRSSLRLADFRVKSNNETALYWLRDRLKGAVVLTQPGVAVPHMLRQYARVPKVREVRERDMIDDRVDTSAQLATVLSLAPDMKLEVYLAPKRRHYLLRAKQNAQGVTQLIPLRPLE